MTTTKTNPLLDAADYIAEHGWCRNDWYSSKGQVCLAGAVGVATGALKPLSDKKRAAMAAERFKSFPISYENVENALLGVPLYTWTTSKAARKRYAKAITVLAETIDPKGTREAQGRYTYGPETDPANHSVVEVVVNRNDSTYVDEGKKPFKSKAQVIALLKRAAKKYDAVAA